MFDNNREERRVFQAKCQNCCWKGPFEESKEAAYSYSLAHINSTKHDCIIRQVEDDNGARWWQAKCQTCFWSGPLEETEEAAFDDYNKHLEANTHYCIINTVG